MSLREPNYYSKIDDTYARRYYIRNKKKIDAIQRILDKSIIQNAADIGCNQGYIIKYLIDTGIVNQGIGIDLDASIIDPDLLSNPKFEFFEKNFLDYKFESKFDLIIFASVYHHLFANYGKEIAIETWKKIINNCNKYVIFETGVLTETGYPLYWKNKLLEYYQDDNEIILDLLFLIEDRLEDVRVIALNEIHYSKRPLYFIKLKEPAGIDRQLRNKYSFLLEHVDDDQWKVLQRYHRSEGSEDQQLIGLREITFDREINRNVSFFKLKKRNENTIYFSKKRKENRYREVIEYEIAKLINFPNVLRPLALSEKYGLISEFLPWKKISEIDFSKIENKKEFKFQLSNYFTYLSNEKIRFGNYLDSLCAITNRKKIIEIIDSNINNFMVYVEDSKIIDWKVFDFDFCLKNNKVRNKVNHLLILDMINNNDVSKRINRVKIFTLRKTNLLFTKLRKLLSYLTVNNILSLLVNVSSLIKKKIG